MSKTFFDSVGIKNIRELGIPEFFKNINGNKLFIGIMMIFMNLGSRYIEIKLTKGQEMMLKNIAREVLIFTIAFMGSRDIFIALVITAVFIILSNFVFNEHSKFCMLPEKYKKLANIIDTDGDGKVSIEELEKAYDILRRSKEEDQHNNKINMLSNISE
jgi:hypothetical protein|tara:strand:- start:9390 stop:9866 length:477 start_codon:yes stop_codon:yes gene_type:complete